MSCRSVVLGLVFLMGGVAFAAEENRLKKQDVCLQADFDGNGSNDNVYCLSTANSNWAVRVELLSKGGSILKNFDLGTFYTPAAVYPKGPNEYTKQKDHGCKEFSLDGIIEPGEGDANDIHVYNVKTQKFEHHKCASE